MTDREQVSTPEQPTCYACGRWEGYVWLASPDLWKAVIGTEDGRLCPNCFKSKAIEHGISTHIVMVGEHEYHEWLQNPVAEQVSPPASRERTVWTCMSCGHITEGQCCEACGKEAMPGRWVEASAPAQTHDYAMPEMPPPVPAAEAPRVVECTNCGWRDSSRKMHAEVNWPTCSPSTLVERSLPAAEATGDDDV